MAPEQLTHVDTNKLSHNSFLLLIILGLLVVAAAPCALLFWLSATNTPYNPVEAPLNLTKTLLEAAFEPVNAVPPTTLSGDVRGVDNRCWTFLKTTLAKNKNQYRLEGHLLPDNGPTGADWVVVDVIFADGTTDEIGFYNATWTSCREVKADDTPLFSTPIVEPTSESHKS